MKFVCAKKFVLKVGFFVFAIGGGAMYAGDFSMQGLAEHLSLKKDVKSMQFFENLNNAKIEFVETKASFSNDWYAESSITYNVNTSEAFVLENTEVMEANAAAMPKNIMSAKYIPKPAYFVKIRKTTDTQATNIQDCLQKIELTRMCSVICAQV